MAVKMASNNAVIAMASSLLSLNALGGMVTFCSVVKSDRSKRWFVNPLVACVIRLEDTSLHSLGRLKVVSPFFTGYTVVGLWGHCNFTLSLVGVKNATLLSFILTAVCFGVFTGLR